MSTLNGGLYTWDIETGSIKNILDVSRDIWGGRLNEEKIVAKNATRNKYLNSIHYNLPGNKLNSKYDNNKTLLQQENNGLDSEDALKFNKNKKIFYQGIKQPLYPKFKLTVNTNRSFAVGTTEGIYIYSLDKSLSFNKLSISIEVTLKDALDAWENGNCIKGIIYSIYLKKLIY